MVDGIGLGRKVMDSNGAPTKANPSTSLGCLGKMVVPNKDGVGVVVVIVKEIVIMMNKKNCEWWWWVTTSGWGEHPNG